MKAITITILAAVLTISTSADAQWEHLYGGLHGGDVTAFYGSGEHTYAQVNFVGVFRTSNAGETWQPTSLKDGQNSVVHDSPDTPGFAVSDIALEKLYTSEDGFESHEEINLPFAGSLVSVWAASDQHILLLEASPPLINFHLSEDGGGSWDVVHTTTGVEPQITDDGNSSVFVGYASGLIMDYSLDAGITWNTADIPTGLGVNAVEANEGWLFTGINNQIYRTEITDPIEDWEQVHTSQGQVSDIAAAGDAVVSAVIREGFYAHSENDGETWNEYELPPPLYDTFTVLENEHRDGRGSLIGTTRGILLTDDDGITTEPSQEGLTGHVVVDIAVTNQEDVLLTTQSEQIFMRDRNQNTFRDTTEILDDLIGAQVGVTTDNRLFAANTSELLVQDTVDYIWDSHDMPPETNISMRCERGVNNSLFLGSSSGIFRIQMTGGNWEWEGPYGVPNVQDIDVIPNPDGPGNVIVYTTPDGIYRIDDQNWENVQLDSFSNLNELRVSEDGATGIAVENGLFTDNVLSFDPFTPGPLQGLEPVQNPLFQEVQSISVDEEGNFCISMFYAMVNFSPARQFVNTQSLFISSDGGDSWVEDESARVYHAMTVGNNGQFYAGSSEGILRAANLASAPEPVENRSERPLTFSLAQNYPNPFNPTTEIAFSLPQPEYVTLTVHNLLGREVARLVDRQLSAGSHTVTFDGSGLGSGIYLYTLNRANGATVSRRMVMVK